eukprot:g4846.t1
MNKTMSLILLAAGFGMTFLGLIGSGNVVVIYTEAGADILGADYVHSAPFYTYFNEDPSFSDQTDKLDCGDFDDDDTKSICQAQQAFGVLMLLSLIASTAVTGLFLTGRLQNDMINKGTFGIHGLITVLFMCIVLGFGSKLKDLFGDSADSWGPSWSWVFELIGTALSAVAVFMGQGEAGAGAE